MFDSSMSAAAIAARIQELQAAAGIKAQLVNPAGRGAGIITLTGWVALAALVRPPRQPVPLAATRAALKPAAALLRGRVNPPRGSRSAPLSWMPTAHTGGVQCSIAFSGYKCEGSCLQVSLVMVVVGAVVFGYRRWAGLDKPLTIVTKQGDV